MVPDAAFATLDGWIAVSAPTQPVWRRLCVALGQPDLADDARFVTNQVRLAAREALSSLLAGIFATRTTAHWCAALEPADVPCAAVPRGMKLLDAMRSHPQMDGAGLLCRIPSAYGDVVSQAPHWRFADTPAGITSGPPLLGEHTELVLAHLADKAGLVAALETARAAALEGVR